MSKLRYTTATDQEVLREVGNRLKGLRKSRGLSQAEAAERAGIARKTLYRTENGDNPTLQTVIRLLRAYGRMNALENFIPEPEISPMDRLRKRKKQ